MLLTKNANINAKGSHGETALHQASFNGHMNVLEVLLSSKEVDIDAETIEGKTALSFASSKNHPGAVGLLIQKGAYADVKGASNETTLLHRVVLDGSSELVKVLLDKGAFNWVLEHTPCGKSRGY